MSILLTIVAVGLLVWSTLLFIRFPAPLGFLFIFGKLAAGAWSPLLAVVSLAVSALAFVVGARASAVTALAATFAFGLAALRLISAFDGAAAAFGASWDQLLTQQPRAGMLRRRWTWRMPLTATEPRWQRNLPFWTIPESGRELLCDLWQPPAGVAPSGLTYIYFHGSAWYMLDKDMGTRSLFRHLAAQGHMVMDVAYRLYPETDIPGMVGDVKRAVAWVKTHAAELGVDPDRIVLGGSSAGGHLSQLAGYAPHHPDLTPAELAGQDLTVCGVASMYGPSDLRVCYTHTNQHRTTKPTDPRPDFSTAPAPSRLMQWLLGPDCGRLALHKGAVAGRLDWLMGGRPDENPDFWALCSPVTHVHPGCPPTLLMQGAHDLITQAEATRQLARRLREAGVRVTNLVFPFTDHGFDLVLLRWSPSAQSATYELERFLAYLASAGQAKQQDQVAG